jgi:ATP-dependent protease ClpP protease subunit
MPALRTLTDSIDVSAADFTPNPDRAIWIQRELSKSLLERLRPQILDLTSQSRQPITVFIDSNGGSAAAGERIMALLRAVGEDGAPACRIITVALSKAQSAAADLLSDGDFAIASPGCTLLWHGTSIPMNHDIRSMSASVIAQGMSSLNERHSISITRRSVPRFRFLVSALRSTFDQVRADANNPSLSDLKCFQELLRSRLSPSGQQVLKLAAGNCGAYRGLLNCFQSRMRKVRGNRDDSEKAMLNASVAFEFGSRGKRWTWGLSNGGLRRINSCYFFLDELFGHSNGDELSSLCRRRRTNNREQDDFHFLPFFLAVGGALQERENELTPLDAFWLGLIDTVR